MTTATAMRIESRQPADEAQIAAWRDQFHGDGYLFFKNALSAELVDRLKHDLDGALERESHRAGGGSEIHYRMFESSRANLELFDLDPIVSLAEALLGDDCHVIANNSWRTPTAAGFSGWHQDDRLHYTVTDGDTPSNVHLPTLLFSANYYLTSVDSVEHGPTQVIPGSHLFGQTCPRDVGDTEHAGSIVSCLGPAGSVVLFNNQAWHRGAANTSGRVRYVAQVAYGRRIIGHKYYPFMNYVMPEHVYRDAGPRLKRLLGFLPTGAYG